MRCKFSFDYGTKFTPEEVQALQLIIPNLTTKPEQRRIPDTDPAQYEPTGMLEASDSWTTYTADITHVYAAAPKVQLKIVQPFVEEDKELEFTKAIKRLEEISQKLLDAQFGNKDQTFNQRVEVHVPGLGLLAIDEVYVETDYCTESLQDRLEEGWRIIAVCPQPDQRRPDYILGRTKNVK